MVGMLINVWSVCKHMDKTKNQQVSFLIVVKNERNTRWNPSVRVSNKYINYFFKKTKISKLLKYKYQSYKGAISNKKDI